jgi:hypothetical protein
MWQEIIILLIAMIVFGCVGYKVYALFTKPVSLCDHCAGCTLKDQRKEKKPDCKDIRKK